MQLRSATSEKRSVIFTTFGHFGAVPKEWHEMTSVLY